MMSNGYRVAVTEVYDSTAVIVIATTEDKLRRVLDSYEQAFKRVKDSEIPWFSCLGLLATLLAAEVTDPSADWFPLVVAGHFKVSIFGVGALVVIIWILRSVRQRRTERARLMTIDDVVQELKDNSQRVVSTVTRGDSRQGKVATASASVIGGQNG